MTEMDTDGDFDLNLFMPVARQQTPIERALFQEAYLTDSLLCSGMTALRRHSFNDPGRTFEAFFGLSNGIERLAKLILVSDFYATKGVFPEIKRLKDYGHNLQRLLPQIEEVASRRGADLDDAPSNNPGSAAVVEFLTQFALTDRYYNINRLAKGEAGGESIDDPISRWVALVQEWTPKRKPTKPNANREAAVAFARHLDNSDLAIMTNFNALSGDNLGSLEAVTRQNFDDERIGVEGMLLALRPLRFMSKTIWKLTGVREPLPFYSEIFHEWVARDSALRRRMGFPKGRN